MKKAKLLLAVAALLICVTLLNACGTISSVNKYLNKDYSPLEEIYKSESSLSELTGYKILKSNDSFVIFNSENAGAVSYKVFSMKANRIIATFADTESLFTFDIYDNVPILLVSKSANNLDSSVADIVDGLVIDVTYTAYDANGEVLKTVEKYKPEAPELINYNTCIFDYAAYTINQDGSLLKTVDVPEYIFIDDLMDSNDDYYYTNANGILAVYDHTFNVVSTYVAPSYYEEVSLFVLNNGNIFAQYAYEVDEDERKYDLSVCENGKTLKYDLVSLIINAKTGKTTQVHLDYIVEDLFSNYSLNNPYDSIGKTSPYNDNFENIAIIAPIVDKKIDESSASRDLVFMNNKGKALDSLKIADNQLARLYAIDKLSDDRYLVTTLVGNSIIDAKGEVIKNMSFAFENYGSFFVSDRYIYDLDLEIVYDFIENDAEFIGSVNNTIFVKAETKTGYDIISFCDGEQTTVYTHNETASEATVFEIVDGIGYSLVNTAANEYKYYNADGSLLVTTTYSLEAITDTNAKVVLMKGLAASGEIYHTFSK